MSAHTTFWRRPGRIAIAVAILAIGTIGLEAASPAHARIHVTLGDCRGNPWVKASYQASSTPSALGALVLQCLKLEYPKSYQHDEVGIVALVHWGRFQNVNEFGLTSTAQRQLAHLGIPPITLEDGPGGLIVTSTPRPTKLPNELALGATFDTSVAAEYGSILGSEAHEMGYDGVQAPDLNLVRVPSWGRAMESFGESPVLTGDMGAAEAIAIASQGEIPVLKHFGPYSQETDRHQLDQLLSLRAYEEVYLRPFTIALHALLPILRTPHHAVAVMCSYGNVNATRACRSPELTRSLNHLGVNALVRSDLDVWVPPTALLLNAIDLIKPMNSGELTQALGEPAIDKALDKAVAEIFATEFADGLVNGKTEPTFHNLSSHTVAIGALTSGQIEERAAVLLKDDGVLPISRTDAPIAVVGDPRVRETCHFLATVLATDLTAPASCVDPRTPLPLTTLFRHMGYAARQGNATASLRAKASGAYVVAATTFATTSVSMDGRVLISTNGYSAFGIQRTALVNLRQGVTYRFAIRWQGVSPYTAVIDEQPMINAAVNQVRGSHVAVVIAYDLSREGMDRSSLSLPNAQDALISAIAAKEPTVVLVASDGAVSMPWLNQVQGVLEVWNPVGTEGLDGTLAGFAGPYGNLLDGTVDPSGRLPVTFPVSAEKSPMGVRGFWPGLGFKVNLDLAPYGGLGIGYDWYRRAHWPVLFPFGYGLSYTSYQLLGGTMTDPSTGLQVSVAVRDTGGVAGTEIVQIYGNWPKSLREPPGQLVGFAPVTFTARDAQYKTTKHVVIPISPNALAVAFGNALAVLPGSYCLEAATYAGDSHAWTTGSVSLGPGAGGTVSGPPTRLSPGSCPA